jgi:hypothetical protein
MKQPTLIRPLLARSSLMGFTYSSLVPSADAPPLTYVFSQEWATGMRQIFRALLAGDIFADNQWKKF